MILQSWLLTSTGLTAQVHACDTGITPQHITTTVHGCQPLPWKTVTFS